MRTKQEKDTGSSLCTQPLRCLVPAFPRFCSTNGLFLQISPMMEVRVQLVHSAKLVTICSTIFLLPIFQLFFFFHFSSNFFFQFFCYSLLFHFLCLMGFIYFYVFTVTLVGLFRKENKCVFNQSCLNSS